MVVMRRAARGQSGFTLLELVVVLGLMTLLLGLVMPGFYRGVQRERDRATLRELASALRAARSVAANQRQRVRLFMDVKTGNYRLEGTGRTGRLSRLRLSDAHLVWQDDEKRRGYIAFYSDGTSSGGYLNLVDATGRHHILRVEIVTGKVTLKTGGT
jgi:general secretion pathway protein H